MDKSGTFRELKKNPKNVRFNRLCKIVNAFGFNYRGGKGSHVIYVREGVEELLNLQNVRGFDVPFGHI